MHTRWAAVPAVLVAVALSACGSGTGAPGGAGTASTATGGSLAKGASPLCAKPASSPQLSETLDSDPGIDVSSATGLTAINSNQPGQDGAFTAGTTGGRKAIEVVPGQDQNGTPYGFLNLYFTTGGALPAGTTNVMLCVEYYDSPAGAPIAAQYAGNDPVGPVNGAYNAAPEAYLTGGTNRWLTASFTFSNVNFMGGASGRGMENGGTDFRLTSNKANPFWVDKAWLVTTGVTPHAPLANTPAAPTAK